jgi:trigger factor
MQVSVETTSGLERRLTIAIPADKIQSEVDKRIQKVAPQVKLDGFRSGKVPIKVVRQRFGESIRQEVLGDMMSSTFQDAVNQEKLKPTGQPKVELKKSDAGKDFSFTATFEVFPEFKVVDLKGVAIERPVTELNDADVDQMIETLRKQSATFKETNKSAADGDQVNIDFEGFKDGVAFEGGSSKGSDLVLGSNSMIPGFESGLMGVKAGEEKELNLTFPETYHAEELKGAAVVFKVKVNAVKETVLPEIDSTFMEKFGVTDSSIDTLKAEVKKNMERELKQALKHRIKQQVLDAALEKNAIDVPKSLIDQEINVMRRQMFQQFGGGAQMPDLDMNLLPAELFSEQASRRVGLGLLLNQLIEDKKLKADADKVRETVEEIASGYDAKEEVVNYYYKNKQQLAQIEAVVLEDLAVEVLLNSASVSDAAVSYEELMKSVSDR